MRNGIFRVYVHSNAGDIISRDGRTIIGASLSEPHINGTAVRELYIYYYYYGTSVTRNYIPSDALRT